MVMEMKEWIKEVRGRERRIVYGTGDGMRWGDGSLGRMGIEEGRVNDRGKDRKRFLGG